MNSHRRMAKEFEYFVLLIRGGIDSRQATKLRKRPKSKAYQALP
jgi:hypothetical protein